MVFLSLQAVLLKDFTVQCLILEHGYYTATRGHKNIWVFPNDTYMPRRLTDLPAEFVEKMSKKRRQFQDQCVCTLRSTATMDDATDETYLDYFRRSSLA